MLLELSAEHGWTGVNACWKIPLLRKAGETTMLTGSSSTEEVGQTAMLTGKLLC